MAELYITATGQSIWSELDDTSNIISDRITNTSNVISNRINDLAIEDYNFSNIIGLNDINYTNNWSNLSSVYGNNLIEITSNIGFIDISDKTNRCIIRFGDIKDDIEGLTTNEKLASILGVNYLGVPNINLLVDQLLQIYGWANDVIDDDFEFVVINNTYPFPYKWLQDISATPLLNNANINIYYRRINSSNITNNVEELIKIVAEHEIRISSSDFRTTLNPIDTAKLVAKWSYKSAKLAFSVKPLTAGVITSLALHLGLNAGNPFAYQRLEDYEEEVIDAIMDTTDALFAVQYLNNGTQQTQIAGIPTEIAAISKVLGITAAGTAFNTLFSIGSFTFSRFTQ